MAGAFQRCFYLLCLVTPALAAGCGHDGPERFVLAGQVLYRGGPVPGGRILFEPDTESGNAGTGSVAEIVDGKFRTRDGKGTVGGPHLMTIFGTNGKTATETYDNSLFSPYRTKVDLPKNDASLDFDIPDDHI